MPPRDIYAQQTDPEGAVEESAGNFQADPAPGGMTLESVSIKKTANGGFVVSCNRTAPPDRAGNVNGISGPSWESKDYAFKSPDEMMAFVSGELGVAAAPAASPMVQSHVSRPAGGMLA